MTANLYGVKIRKSPMPDPNAQRYHHGDLRPTLLREAEEMLAEVGLEKLSLRKLAQRVGVTAPALYHHFRNKNDLLCALAEIGFEQLGETIVGAQRMPQEERAAVRSFVRAYVGFAAAHPDIYDLMFGRSIWKAGTPTPRLREVAYATFREYADHAPTGGGRRSKRALRRAQAGWATVHGLCRLVIDGIYTDGADLDGMCDAAAELLTGA